METDGRDAHERAGARERDYRRDSWLHANGYRPLRFTWEQVHHRADEVLATLHAVLAVRVHDAFLGCDLETGRTVVVDPAPETVRLLLSADVGN